MKIILNWMSNYFKLIIKCYYKKQKSVSVNKCASWSSSPSFENAYHIPFVHTIMRKCLSHASPFEYKIGIN